MTVFFVGLGIGAFMLVMIFIALIHATFANYDEFKYKQYMPKPKKRKDRPSVAWPVIIKDRYKPMLAKPMPELFNPTGWWMSEKLDGVRAVWTGTHFVSRNGKPFNAPAWFTECLPKNVVLDGELYMGRGKFQETVGKVRSNTGDWEGIRFMVFDIINNWESLESRQKGLRDLILISPVEIVQQTACLSPAHLASYEKAIVEAGGEGVMLRKPRSYYEHRRSGKLLKLKRFNTDEATVMGYENGNGQFSGMVGALVCSFRGKTFSLGSGLAQADRKTPPPIGSRVTFKFFELTRDGLPRFPVFITTRDYEGCSA